MSEFDLSESKHERREVTWTERSIHPMFTVKRWRTSDGVTGIDCTVLMYADSGGIEYAKFSLSEANAREFIAALAAACDEKCAL